MELAVYKELGSRELRWQVKFAPEIAAAAGEHRPGAGLIAMQIFCQFENAIQIGSRASILAGLVRLAQSLANQVFGKNGFFAMRFILWCARLEIEAERPAFFTLGVELSELTDFFAGNGHDFLLSAVDAFNLLPILETTGCHETTRSLNRLASGAKWRKCWRANSMEDRTSSGLRSVMTPISSSENPSMACKIKASRSARLAPSRANCTSVTISSEEAMSSGVDVRRSAITFSPVRVSSG